MRQHKSFYITLITWSAIFIALITMLLLGGWLYKQRECDIKENLAAKKLYDCGASVYIDSSSWGRRLTGTPRKKPYVFFSDTPVTDTELLTVREMPNIGFLQINSPNVTDKGLETIGHLTSLYELIVENAAITDDGLRSVKNLRNLKNLTLEECDQLSDAGLENLNTLQELEFLSVKGCIIITQEGVARLKRSLKHTAIHWGEKEKRGLPAPGSS